MTKNLNFFLFIIVPFILIKVTTISFLGYGPGIPFGAIHHPDSILLQNDLYNTIKYWHYSPPLLNFIFGLLLKVFNGDLLLVDKIYFFYNVVISFFITVIAYYFCLFFGLSKKKTIFILLFVMLNPTIIFYENYSRPVYAHTVAFLFTLICFLSFKFFYTKKNIYIFYIYLVSCIMTYVWTLFHPVLLVIILLSFIFLFKIKDKFSITMFIIFFIISLLPSIKNKIIFNTFSGGSHMWIQISQTLPHHIEGCLQPLKDIIKIERKQPAPNPEKLTNLHASLKEKPITQIENHLNLNHIAYIRNTNLCKNWVIDKLINDPYLYPKKRIKSFIASHSKLGFEFVVGSPEKLKRMFEYKNKKKTKFLKQIIILFYMIFVYSYFLYLIFSIKSKKFRNSLLLIFLFYFYILSVGHLFNGYEQERMLYGGFFIHCLFYIFLGDKNKILIKHENRSIHNI